MASDQSSHIRPELEFFATALDDCFFHVDSVEQNPSKILTLLEVFRDYSIQRLHPVNAVSCVTEHPQNVSFECTTQAGPDAPLQNLSASTETSLWEEEAQTWDLLRRVLPLRYSFLDSHVPPAPTSFVGSSDTLPRAIWSAF